MRLLRCLRVSATQALVSVLSPRCLHFLVGIGCTTLSCVENCAGARQAEQLAASVFVPLLDADLLPRERKEEVRLPALGSAKQKAQRASTYEKVCSVTA